MGETWPNPTVDCVFVDEGRVIARARMARGGTMEIGPLATPDEIVSVLCRWLLARDEVFDEARVQRAVRERGFSYVPAEWTFAPPAMSMLVAAAAAS